MNQPLFRHEVIQARTSQWTGSIVLARPVPMRLAAGIAFVFTVMLVTYLCLGEYTRKVRISGQIVPQAGILKAVAPQFGRVVARRVHDGDTVKAGQILYELSSERAGDGGGIDMRIAASLQARGDLLEKERALQTQQLRQREKSLYARGKTIEGEITRLGLEMALQKERIASSEKMVMRFRSLRDQGFVSEIQLSQNENDLSDQRARGQTLERAKLTSERDLIQVQEDIQQISGQIRLNTTQSERAVATLDQESAEQQGRSRLQVLAPADGTVTALAFEPGQTVQAGAVLAAVIPAGSVLEAHLMAPSRSIGFIEPGQTVLLRLSAFPFQKFGQAEGTVLRVEQSPIGQAIAETSTDPSAVGEPIYRVIVKLARQSVRAYGKEQPYRAGMTLEADINQDSRRLFEWVIDPIISAAKGHT